MKLNNKKIEKALRQAKALGSQRTKEKETINPNYWVKVLK